MGAPALGPGTRPCASWCCQTAVPGDVIARQGGERPPAAQSQPSGALPAVSSRQHAEPGAGGTDSLRAPRDPGQPPARVPCTGKASCWKLPSPRQGSHRPHQEQGHTCQRIQLTHDHHRPQLTAALRPRGSRRPHQARERPCPLSPPFPSSRGRLPRTPALAHAAGSSGPAEPETCPRKGKLCGQHITKRSEKNQSPGAVGVGGAPSPDFCLHWAPRVKNMQGHK